MIAICKLNDQVFKVDSSFFLNEEISGLEKDKQLKNVDASLKFSDLGY
jgi:hypothetical protein